MLSFSKHLSFPDFDLSRGDNMPLGCALCRNRLVGQLIIPRKIYPLVGSTNGPAAATADELESVENGKRNVIFKRNKTAAIFGCGHCFHKECLTGYFINAKSKSGGGYVTRPCPICHQEFKIDDIIDVDLLPDQRQRAVMEKEANGLFNENCEIEKGLRSSRAVYLEREQFLQSVLGDIKNLDNSALSASLLPDEIKEPSAEADQLLQARDKETIIKALKLGGLNRCFIIANVGEYHLGSMLIAKELIELAKECGVNCINFNMRAIPFQPPLNDPKLAFCAPKPAERVLRFIVEDSKKQDFSEWEFKELQDYATKHVGIHFIGTVSDKESAMALCRSQIPLARVEYNGNKCKELIELLASWKQPVILSGEMSLLSDFKTLDNVVRDCEESIDLLSLSCCNTDYEKEVEANLNILDFFSEKRSCLVGYSGIEEGTANALSAAAHGVKIIEKGFALKKGRLGLDYTYCLDPVEMEEFVRSVREIEKTLGFTSMSDTSLDPSPCPSNHSDQASSAGFSYSTGKSAATVSRPPSPSPSDRSSHASGSSTGFAYVPGKSLVTLHRELAVPQKSLVAARELLPGDRLKLTDTTLRFATPRGFRGKDADLVLGKKVWVRIEKHHAIALDPVTGLLVPASFEE